MTEVTKYIADDGTEFYNEEDCIEYERDQKIKGTKIIFLNSNDKQIPVSQENASLAFGLILPTDKDVEVCLDLFSYDGTPAEGISGPGIYLWQDGKYGDCNRWLDVNEEIADAKQWIGRLQRILQIAKE